MLPNGKKLITLRDAAEFITELPKAEHDIPEWQAAMQALLLVVEHKPAMFARIGVMKGLESSRRAGVQSVAERHAPGTARKLKRDR
jgi:hypothetical protein